MSETIEFYFHPMSPPSRAAWMTLEELGLQYNANEVNIMTGEQKTEAFKKISLRQRVPAIKVGDFCVAERLGFLYYDCGRIVAGD